MFKDARTFFGFKTYIFFFFFVTAPSYSLTWASTSWEDLGLDSNLYDIRDQEVSNGKNISKLNKRLIKEINHFEPSSVYRLTGVTYQQAQSIIHIIQENDITGLHAADKYDWTGEIGFCFGRALYAHLELLRHSVSKNAIKKAFLVGPMRSDGMDWKFHVSTLVKASDDQGWYALDTIIGEPVSLSQWYQLFNQFSTDGQLRLFITEPAKFGPSAAKYSIQEGGLFNEFYNDYFIDLFQFLKDNQLRPEEKFIFNE